MDLYLYRLAGFDFEDEDVEGFRHDHEYVQVVETKIKNVVPLTYGYFYRFCARKPRPTKSVAG